MPGLGPCVGVQVVERFSEHGSFSWLTLMPLVDRYQVKPSLACRDVTKVRVASSMPLHQCCWL